MRDKPAGDFDYEHHGAGYAQHRRPDPVIAAHIYAALGDARIVLNVGAGAGSYEPEDRHVVAVEPSASMRAQRPRRLAPALDARAEALPFDDDAFDASMATITIHQWTDATAGLREMRRVTKGPVVILTFDGAAMDRFWMAHYAPEFIAAESRRYPAIDAIRVALGGDTTVVSIPIPFACVDGFVEAFYGRPEALLDPAVRSAQSAWGFVSVEDHRRSIELLAADVASGAWDQRYGSLRNEAHYAGSLRLIVSS